MKQSRLYETPKMEVIEMEPQSVLCSSVPPETEFQGTGMDFTRANGDW